LELGYLKYKTQSKETRQLGTHLSSLLMMKKYSSQEKLKNKREKKLKKKLKI
jgi:hypothetical protein